MIELTAAQRERVQAIANEPTKAALLADPTGYGKTLSALATAEAIKADTILVIAPLNTFDGWTREVGRINPDMPVREILARDKENKVFQQLKDGERGVYLIGREFMHLAVTTTERRKARWRWGQINKNLDICVFDEALALITPIATPEGWRTVGDLRVGDYVFGADGKPTQIKRLTPIRHDAETFRVTFDDGSDMLADAGHIWQAKVNGQPYSSPWRQVTTRHIFDSGREWKIPRVQPVEYPEQPLPLDPYVFGQWLGNGNEGQPIVWVRNELEDATRGEYARRGTGTWDYGKHNPTGTLKRVHFGPFPMELRVKQVPEVYLRASVSQRLDLLRGLMDSDGHVHKKNGTFTFTNTRMNLIEVVKELTTSLGFRVRVSQVQDNKHTKETCWRVVFSGGKLDPFLLRDTGYGGQVKAHPPKIVSVTPVDSVPVRCIEVNNENHLFVAGKQYHVTHNCHSASNRKTNTFKSLQTIKPQMLKLAMSATPGGEKFQGLWAITRWLWPDIIDRSFWRWASTWAEMGFNPHSTTGREVMGEKNPGAFVASLPCYFRGDAEKVPTDTYRVKVALTERQQKQYDSMLNSAIAWLDENPLVADLPIVKKIRLRQMLLGEVAFNEDDEVDFPEGMASTKADMALKVIKREGENTPILFLTDSRKFAERFAHILVQRGYAAAPWTGGQTKNERAKTKQQFMGGEIKYIVATISRAFAEGTDGLQKVCSTEVWFNKAFSSLMNEQVEGRLNRRGQKAERITRYEIYVPDSADGEDWERNARKILARGMELKHG